MAEFNFSCPQCGQRIQCDTTYSGKQINCPVCQKPIVVPQASPAGVPSGERVIQIKLSTLRRTAIIGLCLLLAVAIVAGPIYFFAGPRKMTFKAYVDGTDVVKLRGQSVWIEHQTWQLPNKITVNAEKWVPQWNGSTSAPYKLGWGFNRRSAENIKLTKLIGRGTVTIMEMPAPENQETLSIQMDDGSFGGADWYEFVVSW
jgi:hypothetical protein